MSFIHVTTKFQEILLSGFRGVALTNCFSSIFNFGQISKFKKGVTPKKKLNQNLLWICTSTHYILHNYQVTWNSVEQFQRNCANKKNRTDWLTDGRVKNIIPSATCCMGYKNSAVVCYFWMPPCMCIQKNPDAFISNYSNANLIHNPSTREEFWY